MTRSFVNKKTASQMLTVLAEESPGYLASLERSWEGHYWRMECILWIRGFRIRFIWETSRTHSISTCWRIKSTCRSLRDLSAALVRRRLSLMKQGSQSLEALDSSFGMPLYLEPHNNSLEKQAGYVRVFIREPDQKRSDAFSRAFRNRKSSMVTRSSLSCRFIVRKK